MYIYLSSLLNLKLYKPTFLILLHQKFWFSVKYIYVCAWYYVEYTCIQNVLARCARTISHKLAKSGSGANKSISSTSQCLGNRIRIADAHENSSSFRLRAGRAEEIELNPYTRCLQSNSRGVFESSCI